MWYYFCYDIYYVHFFVKPNENEIKQINWRRGCGISFSIIFGIGSLTFSCVLKDLIASCMNILIYIGLTIGYFQLGNDRRWEYEANRNGDVAVDIII